MQQISSTRREWLLHGLALPALLLLAWLVYLPGLHGGFLFDDFANLPTLGAYGPVDNWTTFLYYITSGTADPTGRPLSLLTFLIDARDWPADPYPFKRTNVLVHLLNGALLYGLLFAWGRLLRVTNRQAAVAAWFSTALWLLHPLLVSTTLYIVQREAMLPATFTILGLAGWTWGRVMMARGLSLRGGLTAVGSLGICTALAVLSKANGALLPLLAWLIEGLLLAPRLIAHDAKSRNHLQIARISALVLPTLLIVAYLGKFLIDGLVHGAPPHRPWTASERLLTEGRVLWDYLRLLWLPQPYSAGLFNDAFPLSTSLLQPWTTLASFAAIACLAGLCVAGRHRFGLWPLAVLFFLLGHLMETGVLLLEIYYEHRNYLPSLLLFWPLAMWVATGDWRGHAIASHHTSASPRKRTRIARAFLLVGLPALLAGLTLMRASLWGNMDDQAEMWARTNPDSPRAQAYAAQMQLARGDAEGAISRVETLLAQRPDEIQLALNLVGAKCEIGQLTQHDLDRAKLALKQTTVLQRMGYEWFARSVPVAAQGDACPPLDLRQLADMLDSARANPRVQNIPGRQQDLDNIAGLIALADGNPKLAKTLFDRAYLAEPRTAVALAQAAALANNRQINLAMQHLELAEESPPRMRRDLSMPAFHDRLLFWYWREELSILREALSEECQRMSSCAASSIID
ncbi:tetratricopeptide repeat protein [Luteimonas terrae]|uniref:Tetratricopeptide repeat protein n=1 Tax=Luteimonas terrae TaxID=1530191 RepID=A0A4R5U6Y6_9GAMM|nr:tetratricopeptide repeat protein [Luteimonas terrae]TDK30054.1 tetratricopeptide repeat protein [Luteimonas terrae]